jgi:neopullulanase
VRGENFQNAKVISNDSQLKISNIRINSRADYLFFDVTIPPTAKAGKYEFEVVTDKGKTTVPFEILPTPKIPQNITNDDVIYLIMTDRFANGDKSNDKEIDRKNPRAWHGGDFRGITKNIPYLKELGITAIWLTPWYDNSDVMITCDKPWCPMASYHGYGAIDLYGVENHFGTMADLREMIEAANKNGIKVVQDQVANHVGFRHPWMEKPPLENWFPPFSQNNFNNSVLLSPNGSPSERDNLINGWFDFSLPDMNYDEPEVEKYSIQNALWWIGATGINGIRQDTIQYMPRPFIKKWSEAILKQYPNYYLVGEIKKEDAAHTAFFQGGKAGWDNVDTKLPSVFDFKLWETSNEVFTGKKPARALREVLVYDGLYPNINLVTTLTGNHDTDRFMSWQGATKEGAKLHIAFILATRGIPHLYYGDEILMTGGHDPDNRKNFPGGWAEDSRSALTKEGRTADEQEMFEWTQKWIKLRRENRALREGKTVDLFYDNEAYIFERKVDSESIIIAINNSDKSKNINVGKGIEIPAKSIIYLTNKP